MGFPGVISSPIPEDFASECFKAETGFGGRVVVFHGDQAFFLGGKKQHGVFLVCGNLHVMVNLLWSWVN